MLRHAGRPGLLPLANRSSLQRSPARWLSMASAVDSAGSMPAASQAQAQAQDQDQAAAAAPTVKKHKRNVALHIGYIGSNYIGLQANRELEQHATIEGVLEAAILAAGFITPANFGDFRKTKWSRSSRTDKGVHSLATVIGLRMLVRDEDLETDPEGLRYAQRINQHLPPDVRVFSVQRTNKSFNARRWCGSRTYEYYLPAAVLGLATADGSSSDDQQKLETLRQVLATFCGYRAFHNFAGNRSQYVGQKAKAARRKAKRAAEAAAAAGSSLDGLSSADQEQQQQQQQAAAAVVASTSLDESATATTTAESDEGEAGDSEPEGGEQMGADAINWEYSGEGPVPPELYWQQQAKFLSGPDPDDPVVKSHYRLIRSFTADDPRALVEGGVPCLRLEVCGDSFMLHQIRHMVGVGVAIARGIMPRELLDVALSAPGRVTVPRAPPHTLLLSDSLFSPFPAGWGLESPIVAQWTGDRLRLREGGQAELQEFRKQMFDAAINELLQHPDWDNWARKVLPRYLYPPDDVSAAVASHATWFADLTARRAAEAAAKAQEQQREEAAAAATEAAAAATAAQGKEELAPTQRRGCSIM